MPDDTLPAPAEDLDDLAAAFARGDLDEAGMRRLLEALRATDARGDEAARRVWLALALVTDLRTCLDPRIAEAVRLRLDGDRGFVRDARRRLGLAPPALAPVPAPPPAPVRRHPWRRWLAVVVALLLLAMAAWWLMRPGTVAVVVQVSGRATLSGVPLVAGDRIDGRPLVLGAGAGLELALDDGGRIRLAGPAAAVMQTRGMALINGRAWLHSPAQPFQLGLPDGRLLAAPGAAVAAEAQDLHGVMALAAGAATIGDGRPLAVGSACLGSTVFPWQPVLPVAADGGIVLPPDAPAFDVDADVRFSGEDARLRIRLDAGSDLVLADRRWSEVAAGTDPQAWTPLAGLPPPTLRVEISYRRPRLTVRVDGQPIATQDRPQAAVALIPGPGTVLSTRGRCGPEPDPR